MADRSPWCRLHDPGTDRGDGVAKDVLPFDELWARSEVISLASTTARVASIPDLIALKRKAARSQDLHDIEALQEIQRRRGSDG